MNYEVDLSTLDLDDLPSADPRGWQRGGLGDQDWETRNSQLVAEWLRFLERMAEHVTEQCKRRGVASAPYGWAKAQISGFRRHVAKYYDGQVYPPNNFVQLHAKRVREKKGEEAEQLFWEKWRQVQ
jgi:hypothetical protein